MALETKAQRFPELNASLPNSAKRFLRKRFRSLDRSRLKLNTTLSMNRVGNSTQRFPKGRV
nr:hypothetical protein [Leptospira noguchii]